VPGRESMPMPSISVIIPAYNAAGTIREALESVFAQTYKHFEAIVVDDCSTDGTSDCVRRWCRVSSVECRLVRMEENRGPAAARNRGIAEAHGEWIAFLDADDVWLPEKLATQLQIAEQHPDAALICGKTAAFGNEKASGKWKEAREGTVRCGKSLPLNACPERSRGAYRLPLAVFAVDNPVATSTVLVRKEAVEAVGGFDEQFRGPEDYDLWMRIAAKYPIVKTDQPLARYRFVPGSLSMDDRTFLPQVLRVLEKAFGPGGVLN
ncbi:unnamed protein product, partial [marine sediment metagenome]